MLTAQPTLLDSLRMAFRRGAVPTRAGADLLDRPRTVDGHHGTQTGAFPHGVVDTVPAGDFPTGIAVSPDGRTVYAVNTGSGSVSVIDAATNSVIGTFAVGNRPYGIVTSPDGFVPMSPTAATARFR